MYLTKKQFIIRLDGTEGVIFRKDCCTRIKSFLLILSEGEQKVFSSKGTLSNVSNEVYLTLIGNKRHVEFITTEKVSKGERPSPMKGNLTLVYSDEEHIGLFMIQAMFRENSNCYETVQTYIDLLDSEQTLYLAESILKACSSAGDERNLPDKEAMQKLL